ncbi:ornithine aminotransferase 2 [Candidatus Falkowbacteria bacterium RIFOXYB2_FULL_34_18]|uniref:Ornithine aminotransferase 2 n=1 Tax=Candidatus Falkowbacteria bacterium RIFOXYD2_FULL_34_120 TaxID=1798007 RepID=A0A1F5TR72_9BACT|nr:MAG: ornithine aminotransferase 2 [Candidatus Falkowbacteria bacterium RIFOXYB2_FULL_34_18]OGF29539.1 MAG: ornithine aminotransferase 2 [Candidatus Falkowbacteria bacterium RIFOXYC12_FULL_34_55]OGF36851.1 MAG: ornithine aminotransferase 2 [Candidatus Falkowbacteria bacterium RIFOXYC2_FULL_34_220]OGF39050.1 MAG: ornithine aminotransferase 2 [Candidatus Falkowbacteria bacterium RIFOXYD12_FULL_34_57]OGF41297.1 MAG: ornithine aminotransferase 2 [Candidatus Falkowbacteria bacterium RIFOXYD2_FULL_
MAKKQINKTSLTDAEVIQMESESGANHYGRIDFVVRKAEGVWLYDNQGKKYLDCLAAYSAANQGHHHSKIVAAVTDALKFGYGSVISNVVYTEALACFLKKVANLAPQLAPRFGNRGNKVLPKNGGVESVETAVKLVSDFGVLHKGIADHEQKLIVFRNNFHGRTKSVVAFSSTKKYRDGFGLGIDPGAYIFADYGNWKSVEKILQSEDGPYVCGILVEPMQGEGGMNIPPAGFLQGLRNLADQYGLLLVFDEIQVGLGRTGKMFCFEHENVIPDVLILGKAISGGLIPLSVCITNSYLMDETFFPGRDGSTYGGYPLACIAGLAALDVIEKEKLVENSERMGKLLKEKIENFIQESKPAQSRVKEIRGRGLFIGIEMRDGDAMMYCRELTKEGLLVNDSHGHTIRISPPLVITEKDVDYIVEKLQKVLCRR